MVNHVKWGNTFQKILFNNEKYSGIRHKLIFIFIHISILIQNISSLIFFNSLFFLTVSTQVVEVYFQRKQTFELGTFPVSFPPIIAKISKFWKYFYLLKLNVYTFIDIVFQIVNRVLMYFGVIFISPKQLNKPQNKICTETDFLVFFHKGHF